MYREIVEQNSKNTTGNTRLRDAKSCIVEFLVSGVFLQREKSLQVGVDES